MTFLLIKVKKRIIFQTSFRRRNIFSVNHKINKRVILIIKIMFVLKKDRTTSNTHIYIYNDITYKSRDIIDKNRFSVIHDIMQHISLVLNTLKKLNYILKLARGFFRVSKNVGQNLFCFCF